MRHAFNIILMQHLPKKIRDIHYPDIEKLNYFLHIDNNAALCSCGVLVRNQHHGNVWVLLVPGRINDHECGSDCSNAETALSNSHYLNSPYVLLSISHFSGSPRQFWAHFLGLYNEKWPSSINVNEVFIDLLRPLPTQKERRAVTEATLTCYYFPDQKSEPVQSLGILPPEVHRDYLSRSDQESSSGNSVIIKVSAAISNLHFKEIRRLAGYERESRYDYQAAWDVALRDGFSKYCTALVVSHQDVTVGYAILMDGEHPRNENFELKIPKFASAVISFAVDPRVRRFGVATMLFHALLVNAHKSVEVAVNEDNLEACHFLKSLGKPELQQAIASSYNHEIVSKYNFVFPNPREDAKKIKVS